MKIKWAAFLFTTILSVSCNEKTAEQNEIIQIKGFLITDALGNHITTWDDASDDWQIINWLQLSALEQSFLNFQENINMSNTAVTTMNNPTAYPNPFYKNAAINFHANDSVKVKLAVVDSSGHVLKTFAYKVKGNMSAYLDYSDTILYRSGKRLRYYYSYSATGQANFKAGYGDVKVCSAAGLNPVSCF